MSEKNTRHNSNDFFKLQPRENESPEQMWERLLDVERKCRFEKITAEELIIAKFRSLIKEKDLKEKLEKATQKIPDFVKILQEDTQERKYEKKKQKSKQNR